ncbi:carbon monoxide dehydrogenase subunit G [Humibacillus xanthopallidus]|uniref:Carbon monoxide dehydrogenase subunit G n=1 Tax=Humibacillus xanthopallidus TaxID=412689 RepID=A0A543PKJ2_9MICO|nr:SRPBCC family protein [Humibacillus xanthopallidus]TQN44595.1 carbon monoxide dehydrogenase subunit G [Humibacillus xanthopallidus]
MAAFDVHLETDLPPAEAWRRVLDLRAHSEVIPLTTVTGDQFEAASLVPGSRFVARTALGPLGFDDIMVVDSIEQPAQGSGAQARIHKEGKLIRGTIDFRVTPTTSGSTVDWVQQISVRGVPRVADPVVARVARTAYGKALVELLRRG